jgi:hypothetical protein
MIRFGTLKLSREGAVAFGAGVLRDYDHVARHELNIEFHALSL